MTICCHRPHLHQHRGHSGPCLRQLSGVRLVPALTWGCLCWRPLQFPRIRGKQSPAPAPAHSSARPESALEPGHCSVPGPCSLLDLIFDVFFAFVCERVGRQKRPQNNFWTTDLIGVPNFSDKKEFVNIKTSLDSCHCRYNWLLL